MTDSIQPDNRSALQMAIEQALDQMIGEVDAKAPLPQLFDGLKTPKQFLPSLAIERGVSDWSASDTLMAKRKTTAGALPLQSLSCSFEGITRAVTDIGFSCSVRRVRPFVIEVEAGLESGSLTAELSQRVSRRVATYKAARDSVDIRLVRSADVTAGVAVYAETGVISDCVPFKAQPSGSLFYPGLAIQAETYVISDSEAYHRG
ncbi:phage tail protein [Aeromonas hydrophila]|uniref:phage tail protein n=1 Tax=Aeromonas hydrophila TaxID=644 RepID=UPI001FF4974D|nr:phage tail protein [Aeromonas hydrophila]MCK0187872.1 phage tail protein [Aeromonas hydrophila]UOV94552.1 phage tail protein [Aeromonas hydrophila]